MLRWTRSAFWDAAFRLDTAPLSTRPRFVQNAQDGGGQKTTWLGLASSCSVPHCCVTKGILPIRIAVIAINACEWCCESIVFARANGQLPVALSVSSCTVAAGAGQQLRHSLKIQVTPKQRAQKLTCHVEKFEPLLLALCVSFTPACTSSFSSLDSSFTTPQLSNLFARLFTMVRFLFLRPIRSRPVLLALCLASEPSAWLR